MGVEQTAINTIQFQTNIWKYFNKDDCLKQFFIGDNPSSCWI